MIGFWAKGRPDLCDVFEYGHQKVLTDHGLKLTSNNDEWRDQENVFVFLAFEGNIPVGGIRFELYDERYPLSVERALEMYEDDLISKLQENGLGKFGEACGLWNDKIVAGEDLSQFLSHLCFACGTVLGCRSMIAFNGIYTYRISKGMGGEIITNIGDEGIFEYPNERFKSAVWKFDLERFEGTLEGFQPMIEQIRIKGNTDIPIKNKKNGINIKLELHL